MAKVLVTESYLSAIGSAIRQQLGGSDTYEPSEMAEAIASIEGYPEPTGTKTITSNGTGINIKDYALADVAVPNSYAAGDEGKVVSNGALVAQTSVTKTQNGTYDTTLNDEVVINVSGGGGGITKTLLYSFNESQGSVWINTQVDVSDIETLMFEDVRSDVVQKQIVIDVANIAVYTAGGSDVYTNIYTQTKPMNVRIQSNILYVSYNGYGPSSNVTKVYSWKETGSSIADEGGAS